MQFIWVLWELFVKDRLRSMAIQTNLPAMHTDTIYILSDISF